MPNGNTAGAERQYRAMDGAVPNRDIEGANKRDYSSAVSLLIIGIEGAAVGYLASMIVGSAINVTGIMIYTERPKGSDSVSP